MANPRRIETRLARFTLGGLVVFAPAETWVTLARVGGDVASLLHPLYLIDFIGMLLMLAGGLHSLRARPRPAPGLLAAAWGWMGANGWRATWARVDAVREGEALFYRGELWMVLAMTVVTLCALGAALYLTWRAGRADAPRDSYQPL